jgi:hypothetical protein
MQGMNQGNCIAEIISAFTVAELGEILGKGYWTTKLDEVWSCKIRGNGNHFEHADTEADARAKMLVDLLENKLIQP